MRKEKTKGRFRSLRSVRKEPKIKVAVVDQISSRTFHVQPFLAILPHICQK